MVGNAEYLLHQNQSAATLSLRLDVVGRDFSAVVHRHANHFTHMVLLFFPYIAHWARR